MLRKSQVLTVILFLISGTVWGADQQIDKFLTQFCVDCHSADSAPAGLDFTKISQDLKQPDVLRQWVKLHDQVAANHMPPKEADQPTRAERDTFLDSLDQTLVAAEQQLAQTQPRLRRLTRTEYENTIRDLFDMPGIALSGNLPADGESHGFDKVPEALDISHVNIAKYLEAADHVLDYAIATRPEPPAISTRRISLVNRGGFVAHIVMNGDGVLLKNGQPDPDFPPAGEQNHLDQGAHERWGSFDNGASVGLFRHEDESVSPYFIEHVTIYPARYRVRTSLWSFGWDQGTVLPGRGTEAARLSVVQLTGDGRGGQHPSYVLGYFNAPVGKPLEHEVVVWLNHNELIGFNTASLAPAANYYKKKRAMEFTGPGIVVDWLDIEGPLYDEWPPASHKLLFGNMPLVEFKQEEHPGVTPPDHKRPRQLGAGMNRPDPEPGIWTVHSEDPLADANRLLANALPKLFRRRVSEAVRQQYVDIVQARLDAGDCFELAMRMAYRSAMVSLDFLYHVDDSVPAEPAAKPDDYALACRLSYFLWNSAPDERLVQLAASGELRRPEVLHAEVERMLKHPHAKRFVDDFLGQWLKLYDIAATDPDKKLYPEFSPYLQDCMVAETRAYFQELLEQDLDVSHLLKSDFLMLNQKLATHYGIPDVTGTQVRRVPLPAECPRGGLVTQASILKITANGTTTSPVPRGAFVLDRLLGQPPEPPPSNVSAIEPDVQGATTIRDQLAKHRDNALCASCHQKIDPPGFALEAFDVIGGFRTRYRSIGEGDPAERGAIDPFIGIGFRLGKDVDASGELPDGQTFANVQEFQNIATTNSRPLLENLAQRFIVYSTGQTVRFSDRPALASIVDRTLAQNGGVRTLLHEVIGSPLFTGGLDTAIYEKHDADTPTITGNNIDDQRMLMTATLAAVTSPALRSLAEEQPASPAPDYTYDDEHSLTVRVAGLFMPERAEAFRELIQRFPDVELKSLDAATAEATIQYAAESGTFKNANSDQVIERLNNMVRQVSTGLFSVKPVGELPHDQLQQVEFDIIGLDCKACSLAVHDILLRNNGVIHATASFQDGKAIAWIDPAQTNHAELVTALKKSNVTLKEMAGE
ncbi:MAG: DUF1592 domain-containing protein [Planctomycetaceae bacterium]|nr:DUF1592 domain-containing protein [Planctomycetaceae bacterium]